MFKPFDSEIRWIEPCFVQIPLVLIWLLEVSCQQWFSEQESFELIWFVTQSWCESWSQKEAKKRIMPIAYCSSSQSVLPGPATQLLGFQPRPSVLTNLFKGFWCAPSLRTAALMYRMVSNSISAHIRDLSFDYISPQGLRRTCDSIIRLVELFSCERWVTVEYLLHS